MRTPEQNSIYMSGYMKKKYAEDIEESRKKTLENYYRNKNSKLNQSRKIMKHIKNLTNDIELMIEKNEDYEDEIIEARENIMNVIEMINNQLKLYE